MYTIYGNLSIYFIAIVLLLLCYKYHYKYSLVYTKVLKLHFMHEPPRRGQPPNKGQMAHPRFVLSSEVLL